MSYSSLLRAGGVVLTAAAMTFTAGCNVTVNAGPGGPGGSGGAGGAGGEGGVSQGGSGGAGGSGGEGGIGGAGGSGGEGGSGGAGGGGGEGGIGGAGGGGQGGGGGSLPACNDGTTTVLAIDKFLLGETDPDGTPNYMAWKHYGMNLDGVISTKDSVGLCQPAAGGHPAAAYPDGNEGKDNSFGKNILPIILGLTSDYAGLVNQEVQAGKFTYLLAIEGLGASTSCAATSKLYRGDNLAAPPQWNGTDAWPLGPDFLLDPADPASAKNVFLQSVIEDDVYRSGPEANFDLVLGDGNGAILSAIPIRHARLEMKLSPGHDGAIEGQLGGVIDTEAFLAEIAKTAANFDESFCDPSSPTLQSIMNQIRQASDIMKDGTQDPTKTCDGISIGIGFTMKAAHLGAVAPPDPPPVDPCAP